MAAIEQPGAALGLWSIASSAKRGGRVIEINTTEEFAVFWRESGGQGDPPAAWFQEGALIVDVERVAAHADAVEATQAARDSQTLPADVPPQPPPGVARHVAEPIHDVARARRIYEHQGEWIDRGGATPELTKDGPTLEQKWRQHGGQGDPPPAWLDQLGVIHIDWNRVYPSGSVPGAGSPTIPGMGAAGPA